MARRMLINPAAQELGLTPHRLRMMIKAGEIPFLQAGSRYILDIEQVEEYLAKKAFENMAIQKGDDYPVTNYGKLRRIQE